MFNLNTRNIQNDIQKKNPLIGMDIEPLQLLIMIFFGVLGFYFLFIANIYLGWRIIGIFFCVVLAKILSGKMFHKTFYQWMRFYLRKVSRGTISVDRGADKLYFKRFK